MKNRLNIVLLKKASQVLRCISHPDRLRLVERLEGRELSVNELMRELGLAQAVVSKHLAVLKRGGIVRSLARANRRYYSVAYPNVLNILDCLRKHGGKS